MAASIFGELSIGNGLLNFSFPINESNLRVRTEQLRSRLAMYPALIISQVIIESLFVWLFWEQASHQLLIFWFACIVAMHLVELLNLGLHKNNLSTLQDCKDWNNYFTLFSLVVGFFWGIAAVIFFAGNLGYQSLLICVMLGLVAGAVTMNPVHPPALYGYVLGIMLPLIARISMENDLIHWILVLMLSVFLVVIILAGRDLNRTFVFSLEQRFENIDLLEKLLAQQAETEEARRQLEKINAELRKHDANLSQLVQVRTSQLLQRTEEIGTIKEATIIALSSLAETRDNETGNHLRRTQRYVRVLAFNLRNHPRFNEFLTEENIDMLFKLAPLHDVGKVGIPDHILRKPGKLTKEEFEVMKTHTTLGGNAIAVAENEVPNKSHFLRMARQIAVGHHEKWDGSGYPFGLKGDDIPIPARLMALADVYDAMSSRRVYKDAIVHDEVTKTILNARGTHFDPDIVDIFMKIHNEFAEIAEKFKDNFFDSAHLELI